MANVDEFPQVFRNHPKYKTYLNDYFKAISPQKIRRVKKYLDDHGYDSDDDESDDEFVVPDDFVEEISDDSDGEYIPNDASMTEIEDSSEDDVPLGKRISAPAGEWDSDVLEEAPVAPRPKAQRTAPFH